MRSLSVLHVITRLVVGGAQENTLATATGLRDRGHRVVLVSGPSGGPEGSLLPRAHELGVKPLIVPDLVREVSPARDLRALRHLRRIILDGEFDVVHTHTSKAGALGRIAARIAGAATIVHTPHGHVFDGYFGRATTRAFIAVERMLAKTTDAMVAISETCREDHLRLGIGLPERFVTIPSGIPAPARADRVSSRCALGVDDEMVVGCVGRLAPVKGQDVLLDAFARIAPRHPAVRLALVGDGPARATLEAQADALGLNGSVRFLGLRSDAPELLAGFDVYVQPSFNEGMGRALAMAMRAGLPVVATRVPGPRELIGEAGTLVAPGNVDALAHALDALLADEALRRAWAKAARARAAEFWSEEAMVGAIERLYLDLMAESRMGLREASR